MTMAVSQARCPTNYRQVKRTQSAGATGSCGRRPSRPLLRRKQARQGCGEVELARLGLTARQRDAVADALDLAARRHVELNGAGAATPWGGGGHFGVRVPDLNTA